MEFILFSGYLAFFLFLIRKYALFRPEGIRLNLLYMVFLLKILCGSSIEFIYTHFYTDRGTADIFKFFDDSGIIFEALKTNPLHYFQLVSGIYPEPSELAPYLEKMKWWYTPLYTESYNESRLIIRLNALIRLFSLGYFSVHTLFMCFISFCSGIFLLRLFRKMVPDVIVCFIIAFLVPSYLFWTSGVLKEGLISIGIALLFYSLFNIAEGKARLSLFTGLIVGILLLAYGKMFILFSLFPCLLAWLISRKTSGFRALMIFLAVNGIFLFVLFNLYRISPKLDIVHIICFKRGEYIYLAERINTGSLIFRNYLDFHWYSILAESPRAFFSVLFRPHILEMRNVLYILPALENLMIMAGLVAFILKLRQVKLIPSFLFYLNFLVINLTIIGLTTPVLGSIVRYRSLFLPFLALIIVQPLIPFLSKLFRKLKLA